MHTGRLFGSAGGAEPVPFLTGPKAEPVLDESITRQAVLLGPGTILSAVGGQQVHRPFPVRPAAGNCVRLDGSCAGDHDGCGVRLTC